MSKRCKNGTRRNKKTGLCEKKKLNASVKTKRVKMSVPPNLTKLELIEYAKKDLTSKTKSKTIVSKILNNVKVDTYRYKYDGSLNELGFLFNKYDCLLSYDIDSKTSSFNVRKSGNKDDDLDDDYDSVMEIKGDISKMKYNKLSADNKNKFNQFLSESNVKINPEMVFNTLQLLFKNVMTICKELDYKGYY
jgi:hypothetical protein